MSGRKGMYSVLFRVYSDQYLTVRSVRQHCPARDLYSFQGHGPWGEGVSLRDLPYGQAFSYCEVVDEYSMVLDAWTDTRGRWHIICSHYCRDCGDRVRAILCSLASPPKASAGDPSSVAGQSPGATFQAIDANGQPMSAPWWIPPRVTRKIPPGDGGDLADHASTDDAMNASLPWPESELWADCYHLLAAATRAAGVSAAGTQKVVPRGVNDPQSWLNRDVSWTATRWIGRAAIFLWATLATPSRLEGAAESPATASDDDPPPGQHWPIVCWEDCSAGITAAGCGSSERRAPAARKAPAAQRAPARVPLATRYPTATGFSSAASRDLVPRIGLFRPPPNWLCFTRSPFPARAMLRTRHAAQRGRSLSRPRRHTRRH